MSSGTSNPRGESLWASGGTMFAGVLMLVYGILGILEGIAGIAKDDVYARIGDYVYKFNLTTWGWIHLVLGILIAVTGYGILKGATWGKAGGVALASLAVVVHFMWLPYQPIWALISIAIGIFVIWALCTDHSDRDAHRGGQAAGGWGARSTSTGPGPFAEGSGGADPGPPGGQDRTPPAAP
ncbi:hypothetical protein GCM10010449_56980 [Streptomyces rectiviolaceus]|uniref:DUF7144 domain-containing protein n=1 Tax=Streptomyces rectiviolaceus TaxID=332591 RepID=A0ABP6MXS5_9ACTN